MSKSFFHSFLSLLVSRYCLLSQLRPNTALTFPLASDVPFPRILNFLLIAIVRFQDSEANIRYKQAMNTIIFSSATKDYLKSSVFSRKPSYFIFAWNCMT